jgi:hypothetical protein
VDIRVLSGSVAIIIVLSQGRNRGLEAQNQAAQFGQLGGKLGCRNCGRAWLAGREIVAEKSRKVPAQRASERRSAGPGSAG